jgi:23S rRNA pseudouridine2605 synthase
MNKKKISKGFSPYSRKKDSASPYRKPAPKTGIPKPIGTKQQSTKIDNEDGLIRLNKFIANSGVCSRREADILISGGSVTVNGKIITELGTKVKPTDVVLYNGEKLKAEKKVYVLLNKPKDYITTATDPQGRKQ